jgi:ribosome-binding protein aMBF1 (putative translation factor)
MLKRYEQIIECYKIWHPSLYEQTIECRPSSRHCILARLDDGSRVEFNSINNTIRDVTKYYIRETADEVDEEAWRKEFGRKLQRAITEKGINQEKLSDMIGISRQMLSRYVRGNSTPSGYILSRLADILECDVRELTRFGYIDEE